jgi:thioredoxin reductase (NADPH)
MRAEAPAWPPKARQSSTSLGAADDHRPAGVMVNFMLRLFDGEAARARSIVIASGARYRRLDVPNSEDFEATSVHYWASLGIPPGRPR